MELAKCLVASDLNPDYFDFFPLVHDAWRDVVGVPAQLILIGQKIPASLVDYRDAIRLFDPVPDVHPAFQAQCIRLLAPTLLGDPGGGAILISDIDMLPMSRRYFTQPLKSADNGCFVTYRAGVLDRHREIPVCYNAAAPQTWNEIFGPIRDEADIAEILRDWWSAASRDWGIRQGRGWTTDQTQLHDRLGQWSRAAGKGRLVRLTDRRTRFRRLDRSKPRFVEKFERHASLMRAGYYTDFHMFQPPATHAALNRRVASEVLTPASRSDRARASVRLWIGA